MKTGNYYILGLPRLFNLKIRVFILLVNSVVAQSVPLNSGRYVEIHVVTTVTTLYRKHLCMTSLQMLGGTDASDRNDNHPTRDREKHMMRSTPWHMID